jgi:hypothetical protein
MLDNSNTSFAPGRPGVFYWRAARIRHKKSLVTARRFARSRSGKLVSAAALGQADVNEDPAAGTLLIPRALPGLFNLGGLLAIGSKLDRARLVGLLDCTLRVNATTRIRCFSANRTTCFGRLRNDWDRLENAHGVPNGENSGPKPPDKGRMPPFIIADSGAAGAGFMAANALFIRAAL